MTDYYARLELPDGSRAYAQLVDGCAQLLDQAPWRGGKPTGRQLEGIDAEGRGEAARRLVPVEPTKILCVGRNYRAHAQELGNPLPTEPLLFLKPPSALLDPEQPLALPPESLSQQVEHEVELGLVVGKRIRRASEAEAARAIFGYTMVGDITARDLQRSDGQWTRAKGMDGFCPVGPVVASGLGAERLSIRCRVNGELRQDGNTADMVFSPAFVLSYASQVMTLEPGDLVATGTPAGVGRLVAGDRMDLEVDGIGSLSIEVGAAQD